MLLPPQNIFTSTVLSSGYTGADEAVVDVVIIFGVGGRPSNIYLNRTLLQQSDYSYSHVVRVC